MAEQAVAQPAARPWVRKVRRVMLVVLSVMLGAVVVLLGVLWVCSPGKPRPFLDGNGRPVAGSIAEKTFVDINGVRQGMFIRGRSTANPVLLFVHGGPAMPEYTVARDCPSGLEDDFTVCYWDQRGAGLSYSADIPADTMTAEQIVADTLEVTKYLRTRFGRQKIYLMGHSWGSIIGIQAAARAPELYHAYIGVAQISHQFKSEQLAYTYMLEAYRAAGDTRMVRKLEQYPLTSMDTMPDAYRALRDDAMHRLGVGTTHTMRSVVSGIFLPVMRNPEYTLGEKINLWRGKWSAPSTRMWNWALDADIAARVPRLQMPAYFLHGQHDYTVAYPQAQAYVARLQAPLKGFYTFEHSAHSPIFEEPDRLRRIMREDVLAGKNALADAKPAVR